MMQQLSCPGKHYEAALKIYAAAFFFPVAVSRRLRPFRATGLGWRRAIGFFGRFARGFVRVRFRVCVGHFSLSSDAGDRMTRLAECAKAETRKKLLPPCPLRHDRGMTENILSPRQAALDLLGAVLRRRHPLDDALDGYGPFNDLAQRDRAFARNLVSTALRRLGQVDDLIGCCLERPLPRKAGLVIDILRLGAVQLLFSRTAAHAAVDSSVRICKDRGFEKYTRLVNAVLRRLGRDGEEMAAGQDAARLNTPDWLWQSWALAHGEATCRLIAEAHLHEPPLDLTVAADPGLWAERLGADVLPTGALRLSRDAVSKQGGITLLPGFDAGAWWVQDFAAALPARLLGDVAGKSVIDLCAAPGGKTAQLAAAGASVTAVDRSPKRLERLAQNLHRLNLSAATVSADAELWRPPQPVDAVLLDAPCTATGTIRRHPDIGHLKTPKDVISLGRPQAALLKSAFEMVRPGGMIVYCTCSLQPEEGPDRIETFLNDTRGIRRLPIDAAEVGGLGELLSPQGDLRTLPCHLPESGGMDGFFAARLIRE